MKNDIGVFFFRLHTDIVLQYSICYLLRGEPTLFASQQLNKEWYRISHMIQNESMTLTVCSSGGFDSSLYGVNADILLFLLELDRFTRAKPGD